MNVDLSRPVIWTSKGNVNVDTLEKYLQWSRHDDTVKVRIVYKLDGEVVREDAYGWVIDGLSTLAEQAVLA